MAVAAVVHKQNLTEGYPFTAENFHVARDNNPVDKWSPLDPLWIYTFTPADPVQTSTPKKEEQPTLTKNHQLTKNQRQLLKVLTHKLLFIVSVIVNISQDSYVRCHVVE